MSDDGDPVLTALRTLRAGVPGEHPEIGADVVALWTMGLHAYPAEVLLRAAGRWVEHERKFPTLSEFVATVQRTARDAQRAEIEAGARGTDRCPECHDGHGLVEVPDPKGGTQPTVRPCSRCRRVQWLRWKGGHLAPDHSCSDCAELRSGRHVDDGVW